MKKTIFFLIALFLMPFLLHSTDTKSVSIQQVLENIPPKEGYVWDTKTTKGEVRPFIYIIQDSHCNFEAQKSISELISYFFSKNPDAVVFPEGGSGKYDLTFYKSTPNKDILERVCARLLQEGMLCASEYCAITDTDYDITLYGPENSEIYTKNLQLFQEVASKRDSFLPVISESIMMSKNELLKESDVLQKDYALLWYQHVMGEIRPFSYAEALYAIAEKKKLAAAMPNITKVIDYNKQERKIDFLMLKNEESLLLDKLGQSVPQDSLRVLMNHTLWYQTGRITVNEYYAFLKKFIRTTTLKTDSYTQLNKYWDLIKVRKTISDNELHEETLLLQKRISVALFLGTIKRVFDTFRNNVLFERLVELKILPEFLPIVLRASLDHSDNGLQRLIKNAKEFYKTVLERNNILAENILKYLKENKLLIGIFVVGGFHANEVARIFSDKGADYAVICPRFSLEGRSAADQIYINRLMAGYRQLAPALLTNEQAFMQEYFMKALQLAVSDGFDPAVFVENWKANIAQNDGNIGIFDAFYGSSVEAQINLKAYETINLIEAPETDVEGVIVIDPVYFTEEFWLEALSTKNRAEAAQYIQNLINSIERILTTKNKIAYRLASSTLTNQVLEENKDLARIFDGFESRLVTETETNTVFILRPGYMDVEDMEQPAAKMPRLVTEIGIGNDELPQVDAARAIAHGLIAIEGAKGLKDPTKQQLVQALMNLYKTLPKDILDEATFEQLLLEPELIIPPIQRDLFRRMQNRMRSIKEMKVWA